MLGHEQFRNQGVDQSRSVGLRRRGCGGGGCRTPRKRHDLEGSRRKVGGSGAALWGLGKTAIWLQKCRFTRVLGTLAKLGFCRLFVRAQDLKPRKRHDLEGSRRKVGGEGGALWGLGKTAIWLQKCCFTRVLGTLAKLGFRRPPVRPQELKPRKRHDLEGLRMAIRRGGRCTLWGLGKTAILLEKCCFTRVWRASGGDTTARAAHSRAWVKQRFCSKSVVLRGFDGPQEAIRRRGRRILGLR